MSTQATVKKIGLGLLAAGVFIGIKFYNKSSAHDEIKAELLAKCQDESACVVAVEDGFDECFETHYSIGSRTRSGGLNTERFLACFNERAGREVFTYQVSDVNTQSDTQTSAQ